jgi:hypothetical protein
LAASGATVVASPDVDRGCAARGRRAAHPASSVTAITAEVPLKRMPTD